MNIQGYVRPGFEPVREAFAALWDEIEVGASLSIYGGDKAIVDLWGGSTDRAGEEAWKKDTLVCTYSTTKGIVAIALAMLLEEGKLEYDKPVVDYWPQFGAENKFDITVAQLLSHQAGLYQFEPAIEVEDLYNWQHRAFQLASQKPAWEPGTAFGYHAVTWGYLAGELIRQITGQTPGELIRSRIAVPLGAEFYLGVPETLHSRCANLIGPNHARKEIAPLSRRLDKSLSPNDPLITPFRHVSSSAWRSAEIPASNSHASADGLAKIYNAAITNKLLKPSTLQQATSEVTRGEIDLVLGQPLRRAMGFILNCENVYFGPAGTAFGHSGTGGSLAFADPENGVAFAYVMNQLHRDGPLRARGLIDSFYSCL